MTASPDQVFFLEFLGFDNLLEHLGIRHLCRSWEEDNIHIDLHSTGMDRGHLGRRGGGRGFDCL